MLLFMAEEFTGLHKDTTLFSLGIVSEDGRKFYAEFLDYNHEQCDNRIKENVISNLFLESLLFTNSKELISKWVEDGYVIYPIPCAPKFELSQFFCLKDNDNIRYVKGDIAFIGYCLKERFSQFDSIQFVSDVCHYDFILLIDLFGTAFDLPKNVSPVCHDLNQDIAQHYGISDREAFDKSWGDIISELCGHEIEGSKHNALYDAEVIKAIYEEIR